MIPICYNRRNLLVRWKTTLMTACGFTLVVAALIVMMAFVSGVQAVCNDTGDPSNVVVLSKGNTDEVLSKIDVRTALAVENTPGVVRNQTGRASSSREMFLVVTQQDSETGQYYHLQLRGVFPEAFQVHSKCNIIRGNRFRPGQREVIVGRQLQRELGLGIGSPLRIGRKQWRVVGIFETGGSLLESEIWADLSELAAHFHREEKYSSLTVRARNATEAKKLSERLSRSQLISVEAQTETVHYQKQAEQTEHIRNAGVLIAFFMSIGAVIGVTNTMFAAIGQRINDIAVMRLLGFRRWEIMTSFLLEALLIALIGGAAGTALGYCVNGLSLSFSAGGRSIAFAFRVDPHTVLLGGLFTLLMGLLGGVLPAVSAMRVNPLESLR